MKKILVLVLTILILNSSKAAELNKEELLNKCIQNISKLQTLLEYYYIEFGNYPYSLKEMEKVYNKKIDSKERKITVPLDPATGKEFIYQNFNNSYILKVPDAGKYSLSKLELTPIDWGWMDNLAGVERQEAMLQICIKNLKNLATEIELFAQENKNNYPKDLKNLLEKYHLETLVCPMSGKEYLYKLKENNKYEVSCPDPQEHKLKELKYDSNEGIKGTK